jgi:hypothetical protein
VQQEEQHRRRRRQNQRLHGTGGRGHLVARRIGSEFRLQFVSAIDQRMVVRPRGDGAAVFIARRMVVPERIGRSWPIGNW